MNQAMTPFMHKIRKSNKSIYLDYFKEMNLIFECLNYIIGFNLCFHVI